jgi:hypothetical protein
MIVRGRRCGRIPAFRSFEPWSAQGPAGPSFRMLLFHGVGRWKAIEGIRCEAGKHRCRDRDCNVHAKLRPAHFMACGVITVDNQSHRLTLQPRRMSGAHLGHNEAGIFYRQKHPSDLACCVIWTYTPGWYSPRADSIERALIQLGPVRLIRVNESFTAVTNRAHPSCGRTNRRTRMDDLAGEWCTYEQAGERLRVSPAAARARALRGGWRRTAGNDGKARVLLTQDVVRAAAEQPREQPRKAPISELVSALRAHVETLKGDVARLEGERVHAQTNVDRATAELRTSISRLMAELAIERAARRTDQEQLAAARAAADKATAELVELAKRLAEIADKRASAEAAEAEPEPPRRSKLGQAWGWFLRN